MAEFVGTAIIFFFFGAITVYAYMQDGGAHREEPTEHGGRPL